MDRWKWVVIDVGVILDTSASHSENFFFDVFRSWEGHLASEGKPARGGVRGTNLRRSWELCQIREKPIQLKLLGESQACGDSQVITFPAGS